MKLLKLVTALFALSLIVPVQAQIIEHQTCVTSSRNSWDWPAHNNWFIGSFPATWSEPGIIIDFDAGFTTTQVLAAVGAWPGIPVYEGVTAASNDNGDMVFFSNGRFAWDMGGNELSNDIKEGNEGGTSKVGSAAQGIITVRHTLVPQKYFVVTTSDVIGGGPNVSYNVFNENGVEIQGNTPMPGSFVSAEGIAATLHANGVDIWVSVQQLGSANIATWLLTCNGFVDPPVVSAVAPPVASDPARGGIAFSHDGKNLASVFGGSGNKRNCVYDFNNVTGVISNRVELASNLGYDVVWTKDNSGLVVGSVGLGNYLINATTGATTTITGPGTLHHAVEIGGDGNYYFNGKDGLWRWSGSGSATKVHSSTGQGLPTMYMPPVEEPDIQEVGPFCDTASAVDLHTYWVCSGLSAEDTVDNKAIGQQRHLYQGTGITDDKKGTFDPVVAGIGTHEIIFTFCGVNDTIWIDVVFCPACKAELKDVHPKVCAGNEIRLDTMIILGTQTRTWTIDSFPSNSGTNASLNITGTDTLFDALSNTTLWGTYKLKMEAKYNADVCYDTMYITIDSLPVPDLGIDSTICIGDAAIDFDASTWDSYLWAPNGEVTQVISTNTPAEYTVEVTNSNGCKGTDAVELFHDTLPIPNLGPDTAICAGDPKVVFDAGVWSAYLWIQNGETTQTISYDVAGDYGIEVTDGNGCKGTDSINLTVNSRPTVDLGSDQEICENDPHVTFDAQNVGSTYSWFGATETSQTIQRDSAGIYIVEITDVNGCRDSDTVVLNVNLLPIVDLGPDTAICIGDPNVVFDAKNAGVGMSYLWSTGVTTQTISTVNDGDYWVAIEDAKGCRDSDTVVLNVNLLPIVDLGNDSSICALDNAVVLDAGNASATYLWSTTETTQTISVNTDSDFDVTVTDTNGCVNQDVMHLTVHPMPLVSMADDVICSGDAAVTFDVNASYSTYLWSSGETTQSIDKDVAGEYSVIFTDANNCIGYDTVVLVVNPLPTPDLGLDITMCSKAPNTIFDAGVYSSYLWSSGETTQTISKNTGDTYTLEVTDANGCKGTDAVDLIVITEPSPAVLSALTKCPGSPVSMDISLFDNGNGPFTYSWHDGSTASVYSTTAEGSVWVDVMDKYGCVGRDQGSVTDQSNLTVNIVASPDIHLCEGESALLATPFTTSGGYNFTWSGAGSGTTETISVTQAGKYDLHVDNGLGCQGDGSIDIFVHPYPILTPVPAAICDGDNALIGENLGNTYTYNWNTGATTPEISVGVAGTYNVEVTSDRGCMSDMDILVTVNSNPTPDLGADINECTGTVVTLSDANAQTGQTYAWSTGATTSTISPTSDGTYSLTTTTTVGCVGTDDVLVSFIPIPQVNLGPDTVICEGETYTINAGNPGLNILWNTGATTQTITVDQTGFYDATVSQGGCPARDTMKVDVLSLPTSAIDQTLGSQPYCFNELDQPITISAGSSSVYNYSWGTGETTKDIDVTQAGTYVVEISAGKCSITDKITLNDFCPSTLFVPNSFTPDGDGLNDSFNASGTYIGDYEMYIYNRWGELIYKSESLTQDWDGMYKGKEVQLDVYVYKIYYSVNHPDGNPRRETKVGTVTVMR